MFNFIFNESASKVKLTAFLFKAEEEYPGMYSFKGVKAINKMVVMISSIEKIPPKTNTFKRDSFKEKRSSKVSSFKTTNRYLSVSFRFSFPFFLSLLLTKMYLIFNKYTTNASLRIFRL